MVLFYHFAFLAISIALLGLGAGGVFAYLLKGRLARFPTRTLSARLCMVNSLLVLLVLEIVLHVPVALTVTGKNFLHLSVLYVAAAFAFLPDWIIVLGGLCTRDMARLPTLRSRFVWRSASLSGGRAVAQLGGRTEHDSHGRVGNGCRWHGVGSIFERAQVVRPCDGGIYCAHRGKLLEPAD